jgi:hypothetical protein
MAGGVHIITGIRICVRLVSYTKGNTVMTSKITLAASAILIAISSAAVASTANVPPRHHAAQASPQAFDFAAPTSAGEPNAYQYHGGPKSNSTIEVQ